MEKTLHIYTIEGTDFIVDVANLQLKEKANPENKILLFDMRDVGDGYVFDYSLKTKNIPELFSGDDSVKEIKIPELVQLDSIGMAEKYGIPIHAVKGKSDLELMVNQEALQQRLSGLLPTIDIAEQTFYVDIRMDMLRPKDDFLSKGIVFSQIDHYYNDEQERYTIPYNPKTHEFQELDYDHITAVPQDLMVVSFPHEMIMDPVGFNRKGGWNETEGLKETNIKPHFEAKIVDWRETEIDQTIQKNIERTKKQQEKQPEKNNIKRQRRGPKL